MEKPSLSLNTIFDEFQDYFGLPDSSKLKAWEKFVREHPPTGLDTEFPYFCQKRFKWYWIEIDDEFLDEEDFKNAKYE